MCRILRSCGIWRSSLLVLLVLLSASRICSAQSQAYLWQATLYGETFSGSDAVTVASEWGQLYYQALANSCQSGGGSWCPTGASDVVCSPSGSPTSAGEASVCSMRNGGWSQGPGCSAQGVTCTTPPSGYDNASVNLGSVVNASPGCGALSGQSQVFGGASGNAPSSECSGGCVYVPDGVGVVVPGMSGWGQSYTATGASCSTQASGTVGANCVSGPNGTYCAQTQGSGAGQCGTVNGDQVCPGSIPAGGCVSYESGAVACTAGAPGAPGGAPTTTITTVDAGGNQTTVNYYNSSVVASSSSSTVSSSGGQNVGNGGQGDGQCGSAADPCNVTGTGTGGGGSAPNAANGDCGAGGVDCSASGNPLPVYDWSSDSWSGALTSFWQSVSGGPIGQALSGISQNWPSAGSCPSETVRIVTLNYQADYGTPLCNVWENSAVPVLSAVMLAVWSIVAVFIFLSA